MNGSGTGTDSFNGGEKLVDIGFVRDTPFDRGIVVLFTAISATPRRISKLRALVVILLTRFPPYCMHEDSAPYREELPNKAVQAQYGAE